MNAYDWSAVALAIVGGAAIGVGGTYWAWNSEHPGRVGLLMLVAYLAIIVIGTELAFQWGANQ